MSDGLWCQREDGAQKWVMGKWIDDQKKRPKLGAKIRIPSVLNEIFKHTLVRGRSVTEKGWLWRIVIMKSPFFTQMLVHYNAKQMMKNSSVLSVNVLLSC